MLHHSYEKSLNLSSNSPLPNEDYSYDSIEQFVNYPSKCVMSISELSFGTNGGFTFLAISIYQFNF